MRKRQRPTFSALRNKSPSLLLLAILLFAALASESPCVLLLSASAVAWHEGGHLLLFLLVGAGAPRLSADAFGLRLASPLPLSPSKEAAVCLGGPLFNLLGAYLLFLLSGEFFRLYATLHLSFALFNLFPILTTDGGRLLFLLLHLFFPLEKAKKIHGLISALFLSFLCFFCVFLFYFGGIGLYGLFFSVFFFWKTVSVDFDKI